MNLRGNAIRMSLPTATKVRTIGRATVSRRPFRFWKRKRAISVPCCSRGGGVAVRRLRPGGAARRSLCLRPEAAGDGVGEGPQGGLQVLAVVGVDDAVGLVVSH